MDYASSLQNAGQAAINNKAPQSKQVSYHAEQLHDLASRLQSLNDRLASTLDRLYGVKLPSVAKDQAPQPNPAGALLIAQFGAERIRQQIETLDNQVCRIEELA